MFDERWQSSRKLGRRIPLGLRDTSAVVNRSLTFFAFYLIMTEETSTTVNMNIATISAGFEKGDFLVREEQGNRVYFDFFEEVRCFLKNR